MAKRAYSIRLDDALVKEVRRFLGAHSDSDAVRRALEDVREHARQVRFFKRWGGKGGPDAFSAIHPRRS